MKLLLITDRYSDSSRMSIMKIRRTLNLGAECEMKVVETMPWIRISLSFDEKLHDSQMLIRKLRTIQCVAAEV